MSKDLRKREIRRILLGYIAFDADSNLIAAERGFRIRSLGLLNGSAAARVLGVKVRRRGYACSDPEEAAEACLQAFAKIGRRVILEDEPDVAAVFLSPVFFNPSILTAEFQDGRLLLSAYTARSFMTKWNALHAFRQWRKYMPEGIREKDLVKTERMEKQKRRQQLKDRKMQNRRAVIPEEYMPEQNTEAVYSSESDDIADESVTMTGEAELFPAEQREPSELTARSEESE